jgi:hypothetical protein
VIGMLPLSASADLLVLSQPTNGGSFDLTPYSDFVHFTGTASNSGGSVFASLGSNGLPTTAIVQGSRFHNFTDTYTNGSGQISQPDNDEVLELLHGGGSPDPNSRLWFGEWGEPESVSFDLTIPTSVGRAMLFVGGATEIGGGATLTATMLGSNNSDTRVYTTPDVGHWGNTFHVYWVNETPGDTLRFELTNIPARGIGNTGVIGAALVPEPSALWLAAIGCTFLGAAALRRGNRQR